MANEDKTRQISVDGQVFDELVNAVRDLSTKFTNQEKSQEERLNSVEQIILARLNDTRPFEKQLAAQLNEMNNKINELSAGQTAMREEQTAMREEQAAMREEQAAMRAEFGQFRQETSLNFRTVNKKLGILNEDFLNNRTEYALLEKRVDDLESRAA